MLSGSSEGRGRGGEEWEELLCRETEREGRTSTSQLHVETFTIIIISISSIWLSS